MHNVPICEIIAERGIYLILKITPYQFYEIKRKERGSKQVILEKAETFIIDNIIFISQNRMQENKYII